MTGFGLYGFGEGPFGIGLPKKPRVFVSYHHDQDRDWYDSFTRLFGDAYDLFTDTSPERRVDSDDADYVRRRIREDNIAGSSSTVVLCGVETWKRRWVDWEIQMTLNKEHALLGIILPTQAQNTYYWPERLLDNLKSGFAHWLYWPQDAKALAAAVARAQELARTTSRIVNSRAAMERSLS